MVKLYVVGRGVEGGVVGTMLLTYPSLTMSEKKEKVQSSHQPPCY